MANMLRRLTSLNRIRMGMFKQVYGSHYCDAPDMPYFETANWMGALKNPDLYLANITIPGTHDSMTSTCLNMRHWSVCQSMSLPDQLKLGIRYLDLRCREFQNSLSIYHGPISANQTLLNCIEEMKKFLQDNERECLLVRVKREPFLSGWNNATDESSKVFCKLFTKALDNYENLFWQTDTIPTVNEAAGKIVILHDFDLEPGKKPQGIPYNLQNIEDRFKQWSTSARYNLTHTNLELAAKSNEIQRFFVTHSSAVIRPHGIPSWTARKVNPLLNDYIKNKKKRFGIIVMDFPSLELIKNVINTNSFIS